MAGFYLVCMGDVMPSRLSIPLKNRLWLPNFSLFATVSHCFGVGNDLAEQACRCQVNPENSVGLNVSRSELFLV